LVGSSRTTTGEGFAVAAQKATSRRTPPDVGAAVGPLAEVERVDEHAGTCGGVTPGCAAEAGDELDELARRETAGGHLRLRLQRAPRPPDVRSVGHVVAVHRDPPARRLRQADELVDEGRLARAVGPEQTVDFGRRHRQRHAVVRYGPVAVDLPEIFDEEAHRVTRT
jgi:hypothetical protein